MIRDWRLVALIEAAEHANYCRAWGHDPLVLLEALGEPVSPYLAKLPPYLLWRRVEVVMAEQWPFLDHSGRRVGPAEERVVTSAQR